VLPSLLRFATRLTRDPVAAEDLLQDALVVALRKLDQLQHDDAFRSWASRIVYRTYLNRRGARPDAWNVVWLAVDRDVREASLPGPEHATTTRRLGARLQRAISELPEHQREAVWLVDGLGFTFAETATVLDVPAGTIASRVCRARAALRSDLEDDARARGVIA
jgi:RNA polymerase sigma-70 factor (ECF subfamily)